MNPLVSMNRDQKYFFSSGTSKFEQIHLLMDQSRGSQAIFYATTMFEPIDQLKEDVADFLNQKNDNVISAADYTERRFEKYLKLLSQESNNVISDSTVNRAQSYWSKLKLDILTLPVPQAGINESGSICFVWDKGAHHFEFEILSSDKSEWFYRNRITHEIRGNNLESREELDPNFVKLLQHVF